MVSKEWGCRLLSTLIFHAELLCFFNCMEIFNDLDLIWSTIREFKILTIRLPYFRSLCQGRTLKTVVEIILPVLSRRGRARNKRKANIILISDTEFPNKGRRWWEFEVLTLEISQENHAKALDLQHFHIRSKWNQPERKGEQNHEKAQYPSGEVCQGVFVVSALPVK